MCLVNWQFRYVFRKLNKVICVDDLLFDQRRNKRLNQKSESEVLVYRDDCVNGDEEDDDDDYQYVEPEVDAQTKLTWADQSFVKPFRAMQELSGFPSLNVIYKILVSLAITSSSAERPMSRVRLIKNRLRTKMLDDWFSSMMILASEKDILANITTDRIIDQFATLSKPLQKLIAY